jgi:hypothetical protein
MFNELLPRNSNVTTFSSSNGLEAGVVITAGVLFVFVLPVIVILICLCSRPRSRENGLDEEEMQLSPKDNSNKPGFFSICNSCLEAEAEPEAELGGGACLQKP